MDCCLAAVDGDARDGSAGRPAAGRIEACMKILLEDEGGLKLVRCTRDPVFTRVGRRNGILVIR